MEKGALAEKWYYLHVLLFSIFLAALWLSPASESHGPELEDLQLLSSPSHKTHTMPGQTQWLLMSGIQDIMLRPSPMSWFLRRRCEHQENKDSNHGPPFYLLPHP